MKPQSFQLSKIATPFRLASLGLALAGAANAQTTIHVDDDAPDDPGPGNPFVSDPAEDGSAAHPFDRIQEAIDAAVDGDEVLVAAGGYIDLDTIDLDGKAITLRSSDGPAVTTVDALQFYAHVIKAESGEGPGTVVEGLTFTGGVALGSSNLEDRGAGMLIWSSSPTVRNCVFRNNEAKFGAGVYTNLSSSTFEGCTFFQNVAERGGAMYLNASDTSISNCMFEENDATIASGGIENRFTHLSIVDSTFLRNTSAGYAGGINKADADTLLVVRTRFLGNEAVGAAGGAMVFHGGTFRDCLFVGNVSGNGEGGGLTNWSAGTVKCLNSTFYGNAGYGAYEKPGGNLVIANSILWNDSPSEEFGATLSYSHVMGVDGDPLFRDPLGSDNTLGTLDDDFRLMADSPCIDAGDSLELAALAAGDPYPMDLAHRDRAVNRRETPDTGRAALGLVVDVGAYEFQDAGCSSRSLERRP